MKGSPLPQLSLLWVGVMTAVSGAGQPREGGAPDPSATVLVVVGTGGLPEYDEQFGSWADRWRETARQARADWHEIGRDSPGPPDREQLRQFLVREKGGQYPLWLVLIGHGTFEREVAKFNLRGPDVSAAELAEWLAPLQRPLIVVNGSSSSAPFLQKLSGANRVIITATKSGAEQNFSRFADYFSTAISDTAADLDHDQQVSLLEAFLWASAATADFYDQESRLATEQALLDDNGDQLGTPATFFRGIRAVQAARDGAELDGQRAHRFILVPARDQPQLSAVQRARRDDLEAAIEELRQQKDELSEQRYYDHLQVLMVQLAHLYNDAEQAEPEDNASAPAAPPQP